MVQLEAYDLPRVPVGTVIIVCPGGLEHGGGIGRQMGYFLKAREGREDGMTYEVVDSRGPWFLGASPSHVIFSAFYFARTFLKLLTCYLRAVPCLVHVNIAGRGSTIRKVMLVMFAQVLGLRYLLHVHDPDYPEEYKRRGRLMKSVITVIFRRAEIVLVLGEHDRQALLTLLGLPEDRIATLHNAVPDPRPAPRQPRPAERQPRLLFLGDLSQRKGVPELLRALASPALTFRRWRATLAGGGSVDHFRDLAADLGIADKTEFPGWLDAERIGALCAGSEVLVLPSHAEGLAMSVLEGLSYGLAVVTTPVGAHSEVIEPEVSGLFVAPGDVDGLASALVRVIEDDGLRERLGVGARRRFLEDFDIRIYAERLGRLHARLLAQARTA
jgi:glycosyltransferase involved in cell wall biosynthesis